VDILLSKHRVNKLFLVLSFDVEKPHELYWLPATKPNIAVFGVNHH